MSLCAALARNLAVRAESADSIVVCRAVALCFAVRKVIIEGKALAYTYWFKSRSEQVRNGRKHVGTAEPRKFVRSLNREEPKSRRIACVA